MAKIAPTSIGDLPSRILPHVSEDEYVDVQNGIRLRLNVISDIISNIMQTDVKNKRQSVENQLEGAPEPIKSPEAKTKKLIPDNAASGLAFAAGAIAVYFEKEIVEAAKGLYKAAKKMLGFSIDESTPTDAPEGSQSDNAPENMLDGSIDLGKTEDWEKEITDDIETVDSRPGSMDNEAFKSGPNDGTIKQLTEALEDSEDQLNDVDNDKDEDDLEEAKTQSEQEVENAFKNVGKELEVEPDDIQKPKPTSKSRRPPRSARPNKKTEPKSTPDTPASPSTGTPHRMSRSSAPAAGTPERQDDGGPGVGETGSSNEAMDFFQKRGWTKEQAAGIVGNLQAESGADLKTNAVGDGGKAYGIAQWHPDRQAMFEKLYGKPIRQSTFKEQLEFVDWELNNTERAAGNKIRATKTVEEAAAAVDMYYERSSGQHRKQRIANARRLIGESESTVTGGASPPPPSTSSSIPEPKRDSAKAGDVTTASAPDSTGPNVTTVNLPDQNSASVKTEGNQPKDATVLLARNPMVERMVAAFDKHTFGPTGTGTVAGI